MMGYLPFLKLATKKKITITKMVQSAEALTKTTKSKHDD